MGHYLAIRKWEPFFNPHKANIHRVAAWIRLPGIPLEFCVIPVLKLIGNSIGKVLKIDKTTSLGDRGKFARLCVELDLSSPLRGEFILEEEVFKVEYEGLYLICLQCGKYGHNSETCPDAVEIDESNKTKEPMTEKEVNTANYGVGPWMVVQNFFFPKSQQSKKVEGKTDRVFGEDISNKKGVSQKKRETGSASDSLGVMKSNIKVAESSKIIVSKENQGNSPSKENPKRVNRKSSSAQKRVAGKATYKPKIPEIPESFIFTSEEKSGGNSPKALELPSSKTAQCVQSSASNLNDKTEEVTSCKLNVEDCKPSDIDISNSISELMLKPEEPPDKDCEDEMEIEVKIPTSDEAVHMQESDQGLCNPDNSDLVTQ
ncbi:uncharacterized protein LOC133295442 [Gastrolobium bilobum]|uniref:uncharacterized protein LOC133295442 n=1 Tax=Gastrolobium bilobum TaxID=150636 RepID=UPI002AB2F738|nr:uncharacterized protein LOC133295442 [Gastrolobium bilobum]